MPGPPVLLIDPEKDHALPLAERLRRHGMRVERQGAAGPALDAILKREYGVIVLEPKVVPGEISDPRLRALAAELGEPPAYWKLGLHLIERAKGSPNAATPIVAFSVYHPVSDEFFPDAYERTLAAGADRFVYKLGATDIVSVVKAAFMNRPG